MSAGGLTIGLDVDNVLYPFSTVFCRWAERERGLPPGTLDDVALSWEWYGSQFGPHSMTSAEFLETFTAGVHAGVIYTAGDPLPGAVATARLLTDQGHRLAYVTARELPKVGNYVARSRTQAWLARHGFPEGEVTVTADKAAVPTDVFLDDSPANVAALRDAGHPCPVLWDAPHNRDWDGRSDVRVAHGWHDFRRIVRVEALIAAAQSRRFAS